ncbi:MAG: DUF368 domain-containing protein [Clostridia bacterium]|nr:DUF368 domain-containing protein [Clostridia bacterium]
MEEQKERKGFWAGVILFLKGIVIGVANVIPGVSGGTIAVITGVFDRLIEALNTLFKQFKKNLKFLIPIGLGAAIGVVGLSKVMDFCLGKFYVPTNFFFVGLVIGSIPLIFKKTKEAGRIRFYHVVPFLLAMAAVIALAIVNTYVLGGGETVGTALPPMSVGNAFFYFFGGMLGAAAMVIPGISGSLVMVLIGLYDNVIAAISGLMEFSNPDLMIRSIVSIIPMGLGIVFGIFTIAKLTELLMRKCKTATYAGITGLLIGSMAALLISMELPTLTFSFGTVAVSVVTCVAGFFTAFFLGRE